jgi:hypothetical protein
MVLNENNDKLPCIDCLVRASCTQREVVKCNKLYCWITTIDRMYEAHVILPNSVILPEPDNL